MTNVTVRKETPAPVVAPEAPSLFSDWPRFSPFLATWDPFREMLPIVQSMPADFLPAFEVKESGQGFLFKADLPGMKEADLQVTVNGDRLTVAGTREAERKDKGDTYYLYERSYGSFSRTFTLPAGADTNSTHAELKDGVLTVTIKKRPEAQPKKIAVQTKLARGRGRFRRALRISSYRTTGA